MKLWRKYLFQKSALLFGLLLFCFFSIFVLVDLSFQGIRFVTKGEAPWSDVLVYYLNQFTLHLELFCCLSFLLSTFKILSDLNQKRELVSLQMAGISKQKIAGPLFSFAFLICLACYCNAEWMAPRAQMASIHFRQSYAKKKQTTEPPLYTQTLTDGSQLIFQRFDPHKKELFDLFWVRSAKEIWYMKYLQIDTHPFQARYVDLLTRDAQHKLQKKQSFETCFLDQLPFDLQILSLKDFLSASHRPLSTLFQQARVKSSERAPILSHLHSKLALPLLPFVIVLAIAPPALRFARFRPTRLFIACSLFGLLAFLTLMDGLVILGENQILSPALAIWAPLVLSSLIFFPSFLKMR